MGNFIPCDNRSAENLPRISYLRSDRSACSSAHFQLHLLFLSLSVPLKRNSMADPDSSPVVKHLLMFLENRQPPKTFCPSEVARALSSDELQSEGVQEWRQLMPRVRRLAWEMRANGELEVLQRGEVIGDTVVSLDDLKGPIRIRRVQKEMADA